MSKDQIQQTHEEQRKLRLSAIAKADGHLLAERWHEWCAEHGEPMHTVLRKPEIGTVMVRGRAGAVGAPFNLGEITVTRASVQLTDGAEGQTVGHGYVQGRDKPRSLTAALIDALGQTERAEAVDATITHPLIEAAKAKSKARAQKAAATKVDFFTVVRGHD